MSEKKIFVMGVYGKPQHEMIQQISKELGLHLELDFGNIQGKEGLVASYVVYGGRFSSREQQRNIYRLELMEHAEYEIFLVLLKPDETLSFFKCGD